MRPNVSIRRALKKLGGDIRSARLRRRLPQQLVAERAGVSLSTLAKIESGEPGVSIGNVAGVLFALGLGVPLADCADQHTDSVGLLLEEEHLPKRIRLPKLKGPLGSGGELSPAASPKALLLSDKDSPHEPEL